MLAGEGDFLAAAALVLLHAGDSMIAGIVDLDGAIAGIHSQPSTVTEESVAGVVLTASGVRVIPKLPATTARALSWAPWDSSASFRTLGTLVS